ncbi:MAG TPA: adenosylcobinamide-GDP ribazoletransferase [Alphaproteobacteria bacterium]|nr:adenosylcobinamide-GDP ribazoletransferase [Alphaproteobacteria bacterium]
MPSFQDVVTAFMLLTRLPVGWLGSGSSDLARNVWAFPVVGLVVGPIGAVVYWFLHAVGVPAWLAASWTVAAILIVTGAFHEDGLADTADGFGGGRTRKRKLEIMRDSRIGSYGAVTLALALLIRVGALAALERPHAVLIALIAAAITGRAAMIAPLLLLSPARTDGMASGMGRVPHWSAALGFALVGLFLLFLVPVGGAFVVVVAAGVAALAVAWLARVQIGGHTGDVLGAAEVIVECVTLTVLTAIL